MESDISNGLHALNLNRELVVVDALNYLSTFIPINWVSDYGSNAMTLFVEAERRVDVFESAAHNSNYEFIFVFDNGQHTQEAIEKWWTRRLDEVDTERRDMPASAEIVFVALLQLAGFTVLYPPDMDGDDAVALLAHHYGGLVLSRDRDMLRYTELDRNVVMKTFAIHDGSIVFDRQRAPLPDDIELRSLAELPTPPNRTNVELQWGRLTSTMRENGLKGKTKRGNADGLTKRFGNMNRLALPLVAAVYADAGCLRKGVEISLPEYDGERAVRHVVNVIPGRGFLSVALDADQSFKWLVDATEWPSDLAEDSARTHACAMLAAEIHDALHPEYDDDETSPIRIWTTYRCIVESEELLQPEEPPIRLEFAAPAATCRGLGYHNRQCFGSGAVFEWSVIRAHHIGRPPLCVGCHEEIHRRIANRA